MRSILIIAAATLALAGCGQPHRTANGDTQIVIPGKDGGSLVMGKQLPANLPSYVTVMPGGKITATMDMAGKGGLLGFTTTATPSAVADYYKAAAAKANLTPGMDSTTANPNGESRVVTFQQENTKRNLMVTAQVENGATTVALSYGEP